MPKKHYSIIIEQDEDGVFIVSCPSYKGCHSYGNSIDEAIENISEAIGACIDDEFFEEPNRFIGVRDVEIAV
jgi:predicted RNase H-like HicB family nuclease